MWPRDSAPTVRARGRWHERSAMPAWNEVEIVQLPYGCGHLDGMLNIIDRDLALIYPTQLPWRVYEAPESSRLSLPGRTGRGRSATRHGHQHGAAGAGRRRHAGKKSDDPRRVGSAGVTCLEAEVDELMKGAGSVHCMTGVVHREAD